MEVEYTEHAIFEIARRGIDKEIVKEVILNPEQVVKQISRIVCQKRYFDTALNKDMLLRVVIEKNENIKVITAYKTSRIERYLNESSI